jgi:hypothetical protein
MRVKFVDISNRRVGRLQRKCSAVGTDYGPSHRANTSVSTCSVYTGDKHKTVLVINQLNAKNLVL